MVKIMVNKTNKVICVILLLSIAISSNNLLGQYSPIFSNLSFYNSSSGKDDLHYNLGWKRNGGASQDSNVYLSGSYLIMRPTAGRLTNWFQTVAMSFSGSDQISFAANKTNNSSGNSTLRVYVIDTASLVSTLVSTLTIDNATSTGNVNISMSAGIYWIKFEYQQAIGNGASWLQFSTMSFSTTPVFLPVELSRFEVSEIKGIPKLTWTTISETNSGHFEIYRSEDAILYTFIGQIAAMGESNSPVDYIYYDYDNLPNVSNLYYQLIQVDLNGDRQVLGIVRMKIESANQSNQLLVSNIDYSTILVKRESEIEIRKEIIIELKDIKGNTIISDSLMPGEKQKVLLVGQLTSGIYLIGNSTSGYRKFFVAK